MQRLGARVEILHHLLKSATRQEQLGLSWPSRSSVRVMPTPLLRYATSRMRFASVSYLKVRSVNISSSGLNHVLVPVSFLGTAPTTLSLVTVVPRLKSM